MQESIVFAPTTDERALDREVKKIDKELESAGNITPNIDGSQIGDLGLGGVGNGIGGGMGGGGGGMDVGGTAGLGALASKIPKPIAGVSVSAALPVALGGAVGIGMLKAMHGASSRMQTSTSLLGQAWNNVWRPLGDKVDQLFIRGPVMDLLSATQGFEEAFRSADWLVDPVMKGMVNALQMDAYGLTKNFIELMGNMADQINWDSIIPGFNWPSLPSFSWPGLPKFRWPNIGMPDIPNWSVLKPSLPNWQGLVPKLPDWSDLLPFGGGGKPDRGNPNNGGNDGGGGGGLFDPDLDPFTPGNQDLPGFQRGGVVRGRTTATIAEAGPEVVQPLSEFERMIDRVARAASGGDGGGMSRQDAQEVKRGLDDVNRNIKRLAQTMSNISFQVEGETFGRLATTTQQSHVQDMDPTV